MWPDWAIFKVLGHKFSHKSSQNIWQHLVLFWTHNFSSKDCCGQIWQLLEIFGLLFTIRSGHTGGSLFVEMAFVVTNVFLIMMSFFLSLSIKLTAQLRVMKGNGKVILYLPDYCSNSNNYFERFFELPQQQVGQAVLQINRQMLTQQQQPIDVANNTTTTHL